MTEDYIAKLDIIGIKNTPSLSYKLEHDLILFLCSLKGNFICSKSMSNGLFHLAFESYIIPPILPHGRVDVWGRSEDLFVHCLLNLCIQLWSYLTKNEKSHLRKILEEV